MTDASKQKEKFSRKEAARYLTALGYRISWATLANLASNNNAGKGPRFIRYGWKTVVYERADLDSWAQERMVKIDASADTSRLAAPA